MRVPKINRDLWRKVNDLEGDESIYEWYANVVYFGIECSFGEGDVALESHILYLRRVFR